MTDSTDTGVTVTLRGNRKKRTRQQTKRHSAMEINTYSFLKQQTTPETASKPPFVSHLHVNILIDPKINVVTSYLFVSYVRLGLSLTSLQGITATS